MTSMTLRCILRYSIVGLAATYITPAPKAFGQCTLMVRDSFRLGLRPHGANGRPRDAAVHDTLKDYWPQLPAGALWMANDQAGLTTWAFAAASLDPVEVDPDDTFNGVAFGEAPAAALLPFTAPASAFTISAEAVMLSFSNSATYLGYTSSSALSSNFETFGALWMSLNGFGDWTIHANGSGVVAAGTAPLVGTLDSGWLHMELTYDPATSTVSGRVMDTLIPEMHIALVPPINYVGMEAHNSWNVVNNLSVFSGARLSISVSGTNAACLGATAMLTATTNAADPAAIFWRRNGALLEDGAEANGAVVSGAHALTLTITNVGSTDDGLYDCVVTNACGSVTSSPAALTVIGSSPGDTNNDGKVDADDMQSFVDSLVLGGSPGVASCAADMNHSGAVDTADVAPFVVALLGN